MREKFVRKTIVLALACHVLANYANAQFKEYQGWHLKDSTEGYRGISLAKAYAQLKGKKSKPVIVAIIDSGFDTTHEDLKAVIWTNPGEIPANGIDDDGNGYTDDINGWNFVKDSRSAAQGSSKEAPLAPEACDEYMSGRLQVFQSAEYVHGADSVSHYHHHGVHTAGIIGAVRNNGIGVDGIADNVKLMFLTVFRKRKIFDVDLAIAIRYAVDNGAKIINLSLGQEETVNRHCMEAVIRYAEIKGVLIVRSAGNEEENLDDFPKYPSPYYADGSRAKNWIEVGASNYGMTGSPKASFSNYSKHRVDVFAPGVKIYSTFPGNKYSFEDGTSMAAPVVSGLAALVWSYYPELKATEIKEIIEESCVKTEARLRMERFCRTGGIVNAYRAIMLAEKKCE